MIAEALAAVMLLTRLPVRGGFVAAGRCAWAFPLVGALVGAIAGGVLEAARWAGLAPLVAGLLAVAAAVASTGGLHEDGLADVADGFGGGRSRARKLEIMRDSRVGTFGVLALVLAVLLRAACLAVLPWPAAVAAGALSRGALLLPALWLAPARAEGLGASFGRVPGGRAMAAGGGALATALLCLPLADAARGALAAVLSGWLVAALARRQIGGYTGDVLGAAVAVAETSVLVALS